MSAIFLITCRRRHGKDQDQTVCGNYLNHLQSHATRCCAQVQSFLPCISSHCRKLLQQNSINDMSDPRTCFSVSMWYGWKERFASFRVQHESLVSKSARSLLLRSDSRVAVCDQCFRSHRNEGECYFSHHVQKKTWKGPRPDCLLELSQSLAKSCNKMLCASAIFSPLYIIALSPALAAKFDQ